MNTKSTGKNPRNLRTMRFQRRVKRIYAMLVCLAMTAAVTVLPVLADEAGGDALAAVGNLSTFIFSLIRAVGLILLGYGILQVGLSFQSHDPSQRSNGILTIAGGIIIVFVRSVP